MFRCPTSEFPICPFGNPTASPEASSVVHDDSRKRRSKRGVSASAIALYSRSLRQPKPSRTMRMRNGRCAITARKISEDIDLRRLRAACGLFLSLEDHADVIGRAGLEVDGGDAHQLPPFVSEPVQLFSATRVHRVILGPDVDDLVLPNLHGPPPPGD